MLAIKTNLLNTFFFPTSDVPIFGQQFTETADIFFSIYPASTAETAGAIFFAAIVAFAINRFLYSKIGKSSWYLAIASFPISTTLYGIINHLMRYSSSDIAMFNVGVFWFITGLLVILFGSVIPSFVQHDVNNLFVKLSELFSSDAIFTYSLAVIIVGWILFLLLVFGLPKKKKVEK